MKSVTLGAIGVACVICGCTSPETSTEPPSARGEYRTGSNIPRKPGTGTEKVEKLSSEDFERAREQLSPPGTIR